MLFSILMPAYNVGNYIIESLESIVFQNFHNYELIIVDDGSCDMTGKICDNFSSRYPFIRVIHTKNLGVSHARNIALHLAQGDYLFFLDADDLLASNILKKLEKIIKLVHGDIFYSKRSDFISINKSQSISNQYPAYRLYDSINEFLCSKDFCGWQPSQLVVKREQIKHNDVFFDERYSFGEDKLFFFLTLDKTKQICSTNLITSLHRIRRNGSATNNISLSTIIQILEVNSNIYYACKNIMIKKLCANDYIFNKIFLLKFSKDYYSPINFNLLDDGAAVNLLSLHNRILYFIIKFKTIRVVLFYIYKFYCLII